VGHAMIYCIELFKGQKVTKEENFPAL
jgi:hypothetical protein